MEDFPSSFLLFLKKKSGGITVWKGTRGANGTRSLTLAVRFILTERSVASGPRGFEPPASSSLLLGGCPRPFLSAMCTADMRSAVEVERRVLVVVMGRLQPVASGDFSRPERVLIIR